MSSVLESDSNTNSSSPIYYSPLFFNTDSDAQQFPRSNTNRSVASSSTSEEQTLKTCTVCGDFAHGRHYNVTVCNGCKGFFRRWLFTQKTYICRFNSDCEIRKESRNACRKCRLARCFTAGMNFKSNVLLKNLSPSALALQIERNQHRRSEHQQSYSLKRMLQTNRLFKTFVDVGVQTVLCSKHFQCSSPSSSAEDTEQIKFLLAIEHNAWNLRDIADKSRPLDKLNINFETAFCQPELVSRRYALQFNGSRQLDQTALICGWRRNFTNYVDFVTQLPDFQKLSFKDQLCIAKRRVVNMGWFCGAFHSYFNNINGICFPNGAVHACERLTNASQSEKLIDKFFEKLMPVFMGDLVTMLRQLNFDFIEFVLVKVLIFFRNEYFLSEDGLTIVNEAWARYAKYLYLYILKKLNDDIYSAALRYSDILNLIPPVLYLSYKMNEHIEMSSFFGIFDFDLLIKDCQNSTLFNNY